MNRRRSVVRAALAAVLLIPVAARAHEGHLHKVMGTVTSIETGQVAVKTTDGKMVMVVLDGKTAVTRGKTKLNVAAVKVGDRVVVEGTQAREIVTAKTVKLGVASAAK
jgi:translation initiation factor IF-1